MRINEQLRRELEDSREHLIELEQREAYSREKLSTEVTRLQLQVNKLNAQAYNKDESMAGLHQQLNFVMRQINNPATFKPEPKVYRNTRDFDRDDDLAEVKRPSRSICSKEEEYQKPPPRRYERFNQEDSREITNKRKDIEHTYEPKVATQSERNNLGREARNEETKNKREVEEPAKKETQKIEDREKIIKNIEAKLLSLQLEKKTVY